MCIGGTLGIFFFTIRTRNNLVQFGIDFLVKLVSLDCLFPLFDALGGSGALRETSLHMVLKKVSKQREVGLTFRVLLGAVLLPWSTLETFGRSPTSKKTIF